MSNKNARERLRAAQAAQEAKRRRRRIIGAALGVVLAVAVIVTVVVVVGMSRQVPVAEPGQTQTVAGQPPNATADLKGIVVNPGVAKPGAPVVAIYQDYQCPVCGQMEKLLGPTFTSLADSGAIQLQYRTLVFLDPGLHNQSSTNAAIGAACADSQGVFAAYHDQVFAHQPAKEGDGYSEQLLRETIPAAVGLSGDKLTAFQQCYDKRTPEQFVKIVDQNGLRDGVTATPTVWVNGHEFSWSKYVTDPTQLGAAIQTAATAPATPGPTPVS